MSAAGAAVVALLGGAGLAVATGSAGPAAYVSEAGVPGADYAGLYRASVLGIAVALALLGFALSPRPGFALSPRLGFALSPRPGFAAGTHLGSGVAGFAAMFSLVSAVAPCSPGCPLPPHEPPTPTDLVHAGASIAGLALTALVMLVLAVRASDPLARRISAVGAAVAVPLLAAAGLSMLLVGRGLVTGLLERVALLACVGWLVTAALRRSATAWVPGAGNISSPPYLPGHGDRRSRDSTYS
ncbi:MAG TPA: DUF998 domain-containing protein [Micromonosporaceae bacterium]|nr:DUF998 domain-containing protein [Micromonosporaceae bacterium]